MRKNTSVKAFEKRLLKGGSPDKISIALDLYSPYGSKKQFKKFKINWKFNKLLANAELPLFFKCIIAVFNVVYICLYTIPFQSLIDVLNFLVYISFVFTGK